MTKDEGVVGQDAALDASVQYFVKSDQVVKELQMDGTLDMWREQIQNELEQTGIMKELQQKTVDHIEGSSFKSKIAKLKGQNITPLERKRIFEHLRDEVMKSDVMTAMNEHLKTVLYSTKSQATSDCETSNAPVSRPCIRLASEIRKGVEHCVDKLQFHREQTETFKQEQQAKQQIMNQSEQQERQNPISPPEKKRRTSNKSKRNTTTPSTSPHKISSTNSASSTPSPKLFTSAIMGSPSNKKGTISKEQLIKKLERKLEQHQKSINTPSPGEVLSSAQPPSSISPNKPAQKDDTSPLPIPPTEVGMEHPFTTSRKLDRSSEKRRKKLFEELFGDTTSTSASPDKNGDTSKSNSK